jgi:hypothetical protein
MTFCKMRLHLSTIRANIAVKDAPVLTSEKSGGKAQISTLFPLSIDIDLALKLAQKCG